MYLLITKKIPENLRDSYDAILIWPKIRAYKFFENAQRAFNEFKWNWVSKYDIYVVEVPDIDWSYEDEDRIVERAKQILPPLW